MWRIIHFFNIFLIRINESFKTWLCDRWKEVKARSPFLSPKHKKHDKWTFGAKFIVATDERGKRLINWELFHRMSYEPTCGAYYYLIVSQNYREVVSHEEPHRNGHTFIWNKHMIPLDLCSFSPMILNSCTLSQFLQCAFDHNWLHCGIGASKKTIVDHTTQNSTNVG